MQIWTKLTLGFAATALAIVGLYGAHQLRSEEVDLRDAAVRDLRLVGLAMEVSVANALRDDQPADVRRLVDAVKLRDPSLDVLVFDGGGRQVAASWGGTADRATTTLVAESLATSQAAVRFDEGAPARLVGAFPALGDGEARVGTVVLVRTLDELRRDLVAETRAMALSITTLILGLALAGWALSMVYVRRPIEDLVHAMRAVGSGNLASKAPFERADEIGAAAIEFNAMTTELADARRRLIAESEAREALENRLQHTDKLVTVGQLSAGLAHEIGSPLQVLNGRARALAARTDLPADVARSAGIMAGASDRIARIVEQLLSFSRRGAPAPTATEPVELSGPVRDIVELFEPEARRHGVRLTFEPADHVPPVPADPAQIQQVAMNLLTNAVRASAPGGAVVVRLGPGDGDPPPTASAVAGLQLVVEDTGSGIPADQLPRIFEPFFTTCSDAGGTGLGLAVVKSIVEAHHGTVEVTTALGRGTRFTVHLPAADAGRCRRVEA